MPTPCLGYNPKQMSAGVVPLKILLCSVHGAGTQVELGVPPIISSLPLLWIRTRQWGDFHWSLGSFSSEENVWNECRGNTCLGRPSPQSSLTCNVSWRNSLKFIVWEWHLFLVSSYNVSFYYNILLAISIGIWSLVLRRLESLTQVCIPST